MDSLDKMREKFSSDGWNISNDGLTALTQDDPKRSYASVLAIALDTDLKEIGQPALATQLNKNAVSKLILQIQKIRNVSAPKANEESQTAPRMLKFILSDGHTTCQAIEMTSLSEINLNKTAPGSKMLITNAKFHGGYLLIDKASCKYLGGKVSAMYEKWELSRQIFKQSRSGFVKDGPPAWVNFGQKFIKAEDLNDANFKSLVEKNKEGKDSTEFDSQRQDAIAEVASGAIKKVFGKGKQENVNNKYNMQMDRKDNDSYRGRQGGNGGRRGGRRGEDMEEIVSSRPSEKVSLFSFLEDKLPEPVVATIVDHRRDNRGNSSYNVKDNGRYQNNHNSNYTNGSVQESDQLFNTSRHSNNYKANNYRDHNRDYHRDNNKEYRDNSHRDNKTSIVKDYRDNNREYRENNRENKTLNVKDSYHCDITNNKPNYPNKTSNYEGRNRSPNDEKFSAKNYNNYDRNTVPRKPQTHSQELCKTEVDSLANDVSKLNVNHQFASKSLQKHLNLDKKNEGKRQTFYDKTEYGNPFTKPNNFGGPKASNYNNKQSTILSFNPTTNTANKTDDFGGPKPITNDFGLIKTKSNDFGGPKSKIDDFGGPKSQPITKFQHNQQTADTSQNGDLLSFAGWKVGDHCMAKYWEDNRYYNAIITAITERTCVVQFNEYGNIEEVLKVDCIPFSKEENIDSRKYSKQRTYQNSKFINRNNQKQ